MRHKNSFFFGCIVWYSRKPNKLFYFVVIIVALCCGVFSFSEYVKTFVKYLRFFARLLHTSSYRLHIVLLADRCTSFAYMNRKWNRLNTYSMWKSRKCCNGENICKNKEKKKVHKRCMHAALLHKAETACKNCWKIILLALLNVWAEKYVLYGKNIYTSSLCMVV